MNCWENARTAQYSKLVIALHGHVPSPFISKHNSLEIGKARALMKSDEDIQTKTRQSTINLVGVDFYAYSRFAQVQYRSSDQ